MRIPLAVLVFSAACEAPEDEERAPPDLCAPLWEEPEPVTEAGGCSYAYSMLGNTYPRAEALLEAAPSGLVTRLSYRLEALPGDDSEWHWSRRVDQAERPGEVWEWRYDALYAWATVEWDGDVPLARVDRGTSPDADGECAVLSTTEYTCDEGRLTEMRVLGADGDPWQEYRYTYDAEGRILTRWEDRTVDTREGEYTWDDAGVDWCEETTDWYGDRTSACGRQTFDGEGRLLTEEWGEDVTTWTYDDAGHPTGNGYLEVDTDCAYGELRHGALLPHGHDSYDPAAASLREALPCW